MQTGQQVSTAFSFWHKSLLLCLGFFITAACSDRSEQAMRHAAEAEQHLQGGNLWSARQKIGDAIAERDDLPELHLLRGRIELADESYGSAFAAYSNALALDNANMEALQAVSQLGLRTGNLRESLDATERILVLQPGQENALVVRGIHALVQRRYGEAIQYADQVLTSVPNSEQASILKSRALFMSGEPTEALKVIEAAADGSVASEGVALTKLELYRELRDRQGMQTQFDRLRQLRPDDADLRIDEANLQFKLGELAAGQKLVLDLLQQRDLNREIASEAVDLLRDYSIKVPQSEVRRIAASASHSALIELARYFLEIEHLAHAQSAIRRLPAREARPLLARLAVLKNRPSEALEIASEVLRRDETQCDALTAFAEASLEKGDVTNGLPKAQRAAAECPDRSETWLATAAAYAARDEPVGVQRVYRDAVTANPQNFLLTRTYGDWLLAQGRQREALAVARTFTRKSPALLKGWRYYHSLCSRLDASCVGEAERGLADASTRYGIDLPTGKLPPSGLFGRLARR